MVTLTEPELPTNLEDIIVKLNPSQPETEPVLVSATVKDITGNELPTETDVAPRSLFMPEEDEVYSFTVDKTNEPVEPVTVVTIVTSNIDEVESKPTPEEVKLLLYNSM